MSPGRERERTGRSRAGPFRLALVLAAACSIPGLAAEGPEPLADAIRKATLENRRAVALRGVEIVLGAAALKIEEGILVPATPIGGHSAELAFAGRAVFTFDPPDDVEAAQLEQFARSRALREPVDEAVLVIADDKAVSSLLRRPGPEAPDPALLERARSAFEKWKEGPERRRFGVESTLLRDALGDAPAQGFFAGWFRSKRLGDFFYVLDPDVLEPSVLGQFVPAEVGDHEGDLIRRLIRGQQQEGRLSGMRLQDLGDWDTWCSSALRGEDGKPATGGAGFEPVKYTIEVEISKDRERIEGKTRIDLRSESAGRRAVVLALQPDLEVRSVRDAAGGALAFVREGGAVTAILPAAPAPGEPLAIEVEYAGVAFDEAEKGVPVLRDTRRWHPHAGRIDRASYDVTLRWPRKLELVAPGRRVAGGLSGDSRWERRVVDLPSTAFSFEVGEFDTAEEQVGHVSVTVAFNRTSKRVPRSVRAEVRKTVADALRYFEQTFGAYPLDTLAVVTVPRGFSQGFPGLVTLAHELVLERPRTSRWAIRNARVETIAHEIAHQWWGDKVGWWSYRDQWLSEALAKYAAVRFSFAWLGDDLDYLAWTSRGTWGSLVETAANGAPLESLGPVVLGQRLASSLSHAAYKAVVYGKGSIVLSTLAERIGQEPFLEMLLTLSDRAANRVIDTPAFLKSIERMSGQNLDAFARRLVYGTGVPEFHFTWSVEAAEDGKWRLRCRVRQFPSGRTRHRLVRAGERGWDVQREWVPDFDVSDSSLVVPFQAEMGVAEEEREGRGAAAGVAPRGGPTVKVREVSGRAELTGEISEFSRILAERPVRLWLDQRGEVLATFHDETRDPKTALRHEGDWLADTGRPDEAEALYEKALAAETRVPVGYLGIRSSRWDAKRAARLLDALVHLRRSRLFLDRGRDEAAEKALEAAESLLAGADAGKFKPARLLLRARLETRRGDFGAAYRRLSGELRLDFRDRQDDSVVEQIRNLRFRFGSVLGGDAYALLAAAAAETGRDEVRARASREAERRGADLGALAAPPSAPPEDRDPSDPEPR